MKLDELTIVPHFVGPPGAQYDNNPVTRQEIKLYGDSLQLGKALQQDELDVFTIQFSDLLTAPGSVERAIMSNRIATDIMGLRAIKEALAAKPKFTGLNAGATELGWGLIRPQFMKSNVVAALPGAGFRANWQQAIAAPNVWQDWLMNGLTLPFQVGADFGFVITHIKPLNSPSSFFSEIQMTVGRTGALIPFDVRALRVADTENQISIVPIPSIIATPTQTLYAQVKGDIAGVDDEQIGGFVFGLGRALSQLIPTWV